MKNKKFVIIYSRIRAKGPEKNKFLVSGELFFRQARHEEGR